MTLHKQVKEALTEDIEQFEKHRDQESRYARLAAGLVQEIHDILDKEVHEQKLDRRTTIDFFFAELRNIEMRSRLWEGYNETQKDAQAEELAERTCEDEDECGANETEN